jgi:serine/threonine protein kinase
MTQNRPPDNKFEPTRVQTPLERLYIEFSENWRSGSRPDLDSFLQRVPRAERTSALINLLRIEVQERRARGEEASEDEYRQRYPEESDAIDLAFTTHGQVAVNTQAEIEWSVGTQAPQDLEVTQRDPNQQPDKSEEESPWKPGMMLGNYRLDERLDHGGFGEVWKGWDTNLHSVVAIKLLLPRWLNTDYHHEFFLEPQKQRALQQAGAQVVPVLAAATCNDWPYLVSQFLSGGNLQRWMNRHPRDWREAARVVADLAKTLRIAHAHKVYHRDIKPKNVLLDEKGQVYLGDFGLATTEDQLVRKGLQTGAGTWAYWSPEQAQHGIAEGRSDVYSLGVVLYQWLTGCWPGPTESKLHRQWLSEPALRAQAPRELNPDIPGELQQICLEMLEKDYTKRNITAGDVERRLRGVLVPQVSPQLQRSVPTRRNRWIAAAVVALGFLGLSGVGVLSLSRGVQDDDRLAVGGRDRWIKTSGVTPEVERHVGIRGTELVVFDVEGERLILNTDELRLLQFATEFRTIPSRIEMTIQRSRLDGFGLYYQKEEVLQQNNTTTQFRGLMFREVTQPDGVTLLLTSNTYSIHPLTGSMEGQHAVGESPIPPQFVPRSVVRLSVNIENGYIESVELDGKKLDVPDLEHPSRALFVPPFGVFIKSGQLVLFPPKMVYP